MLPEIIIAAFGAVGVAVAFVVFDLLSAIEEQGQEINRLYAQIEHVRQLSVPQVTKLETKRRKK